MEESVFFPNHINEKLAGFLHHPDRTSATGIVLAHCFTCSKHQRIIRKTCDFLAKSGFLVLRFDFSGNGESEGKFEDSSYSKEMKDLANAISFIESKGINNIGILGHSMGSAVSILQSVKDDRVKSLCVLGSPSETNLLKDLIPENKLSEISKNGKATVKIFFRSLNITQEFIDDMEKHSLKKEISEFKPPFCIIHGDKDVIVPIEHGKNLYSWAIEPKELHIIDGSDHLFSRDEHLSQVLNIASDWFTKTCK